MEQPPILRIKRLCSWVDLPQRQTEGSAGYDLQACIPEPVTLSPGESAVFPTGLAAEIPGGFAGMIFTRSGLGVKHGVAVSNGVGVIDSDYRGELHVGLRNHSREPYTVQPGERIAQLILLPVGLASVVEVSQLSSTQRGEGGFGSTGK